MYTVHVINFDNQICIKNMLVFILLLCSELSLLNDLNLQSWEFFVCYIELVCTFVFLDNQEGYMYQVSNSHC